ncbi:hypothetical protein [Actinoplanes italicus]|uniref:SMI1/KNR4 family protein n=1 Tax=Actinoplanes italicus TaxID=113567 RepID=A0A2T0JZL5_9ACTN|nr:hypothetical protein [Actinoplanes italicus]PRX15907.1 hypothetical protein CLV67_122147 [Actinoplanes italicus]
MVEQLISRTDAAYQRWLASVIDDVDADVLMMYCRESLPERNTTYGIGEWLPGYLMVGQEGDRGFFLSCDGGGPVFMGDLGSRGEVDLHVIAPGFEAWLRSGFALPPEPEPDLPPTGDVYVSGIPIEGLQLLVRARKLLRTEWRFADLRAMLAAQPFLAASSAPLYRLGRELEDVPELRPHLFYATDHGLEAVWPTREPRLRPGP